VGPENRHIGCVSVFFYTPGEKNTVHTDVFCASEAQNRRILRYFFASGSKNQGIYNVFVPVPSKNTGIYEKEKTLYFTMFLLPERSKTLSKHCSKTAQNRLPKASFIVYIILASFC